MDLQLLIAQWSGKLPEGFVRPAILKTGSAECAMKRCRNKVAIKGDGTPARACQNCLNRCARSCRRRRAALVARDRCRRCAYRKRLDGDFLCQRCREDRNIERTQKRQDAIDAAVIDEFAAKPDTAHRASNLDIGVSPWNARPKPEPSAAYWSPLPDPEPKSEQIWRESLDDCGWRLWCVSVYVAKRPQPVDVRDISVEMLHIKLTPLGRVCCSGGARMPIAVNERSRTYADSPC